MRRNLYSWKIPNCMLSSSLYYFNSHWNFLNNVIVVVVVFTVVRVESLSQDCCITFSKASFWVIDPNNKPIFVYSHSFSCTKGVSKFSFLNHFTLKYIHAPFHSFSFFFLFIVDVVVTVMEMYRQKQNEKVEEKKNRDRRGDLEYYV